jgi:hypothetical protein
MKSHMDFQEQQQQHMQQQIVELLAQPTFPTHQHLQEKPTDYNQKRDTPTTLTAMTDSPEQAQRKPTTQPHGEFRQTKTDPSNTHIIPQSYGNQQDSSRNYETFTKPNNNNINLLRERDNWRHPKVTLYRDLISIQRLPTLNKGS